MKGTEGGFFTLYTQRSRRTIVLAQEEARSMGHRYLGAEHLLLGLLRVGGGVAHRALDSLGITLEAARSRVEHMVGRDVGREGFEPSSSGQLPFTPRMKEVLKQAALEARWLEHDRHIGTEHLLLGLSGQYEGVAARVLKEHGATPGTIRNEVMENTTRGYPREDRTASSGKTIEAWAGRHVSVAVENMGNGEPGRFTCTLEGVDERGIVVSYQSDTSRMTRFYPWRTVSYMNLARHDDPVQPSRRAGFSSD
ncbi:MAG: hypothetical protein M3R38_00485 [Actinomycetota bacterium]|nr:hypothetical protein [Actinomycetota bacterium]